VIVAHICVVGEKKWSGLGLGAALACCIRVSYSRAALACHIADGKVARERVGYGRGGREVSRTLEKRL
jgi:hypothetical protein